ncbi:MAG: ribonuclease III [Holosporales bacterium]|jgi:ribonuclease-3|nr:ribonuclease III [Holosporales bacterium]
MENIEASLGYKFKNKSLLHDALKHSSIKKFAIRFERLEFLGDRILGLVVAEYIFQNSKEAEGIMAKMLSVFVCADSCYKIALKIGIDKNIATAGEYLKNNKTVLADAMEAALGAVFIDGGYKEAKEVILRLWEEIFKNHNELEDPKTRLQEICQAQTGKLPSYELISVTGPDHCPEFTVSAAFNGKLTKATGHSRKEAETEAAKLLLKIIR